MKIVSVIGSGIGGIAVAIRLAAKGYEVHVFEKTGKAGGKIGSFEHNGFRFDTGPSLFTLPYLLTELFELHQKDVNDYIEIVELAVACNYFFPDGSNLKAWSVKRDFLNEVQSKGLDGKVLEKYLKKQAFLYENTSEFFLFNSIHLLSSFIGDASRKSLKALHQLDAFKTMHQRNKKTFKDDKLTQLFDRYATYNGSDPYRAPATLNMIAHLEHNKGAFFPKNGMVGIIVALQKLATELGVQFHLNEAVKSINSSNGKVSGIVTENREFCSDIIINDTDVTYFYKNILHDKFKLNSLLKRERSSSALIFYWGVNFSSNLDVHNILFSKNYKEEFKGIFKHKLFANDLTVYIFISKKVVESDAPKNSENWFVMVNAPENVNQDWKYQSSFARKIIVEKINEILKIDIERYIVNEKIITPVDIEKNTSSVNGSLYGHSSNSAMAAFLRHPNFSRKYKNLYFVGGSVHPGGGIPLCLASAKIVDNLIPKL